MRAVPDLRARQLRRALSTIGGATLAGFDLPTAQRLFDKVGQLDEIAVAVEVRRLARAAHAAIEAILPPTAQVRTGEAQATEDARGHERVHHVPPELPARVRRDRALRRQLRDRELARDHDRAADARVRDAADDRRVAPAGARLDRARVARRRGRSRRSSGSSSASGSPTGLFKLFDAVGFTLPNNGLVFETRTIVVALLVGILVTLLASLRPRSARRACRRSRPCAKARRCPSRASRRYRTLGASLLTLARLRGAALRRSSAPGLGTTEPAPLARARRAARLLRRRAARPSSSSARSRTPSAGRATQIGGAAGRARARQRRSGTRSAPPRPRRR